MIHLDTSFVIDLLRETRRRRPGAAAAMRSRLEDEDLRMSVCVACELFAGAESSSDPAAERQRVAAFCDGVDIAYPSESFAQTYGRLLASLQRAGQTIGTMDLLIAVAALQDGASLLTRNTKEFSRVTGLKLISY